MRFLAQAQKLLNTTIFDLLNAPVRLLRGIVGERVKIEKQQIEEMRKSLEEKRGDTTKRDRGRAHYLFGA